MVQIVKMAEFNLSAFGYLLLFINAVSVFVCVIVVNNVNITLPQCFSIVWLDCEKQKALSFHQTANARSELCCQKSLRTINKTRPWRENTVPNCP